MNKEDKELTEGMSLNKEEEEEEEEEEELNEDDLISILSSTIIETLQESGVENLPEISLDVKFILLGINKSNSTLFNEILTEKLNIQLSDDILFDSDATLRSIVTILTSKKKIPHRPYMIETWKLVAYLRNQSQKIKKEPTGRVSEQWFSINKIQSNKISHTFPDDCALTPAPLKNNQDKVYLLFTLFACGVFFWLPCIGLIILFTLPLVYSTSIFIIFYTIVFTFPADRWPPSFRLTYLMQCAVQYFSVRVIVDDHHDNSTPSIYSLEPHGWLPIPQSIHQLLNEWIMGENFHILAANSVFYMPIFNILAKLQACRPIDKKTFISTLQSGRSVGIVPGGIAEMFEYLGSNSLLEVLKLSNRKGFVKIALKTGTQIIPCYTFGCWNVFEALHPKSLQTGSRLTGIPLLLFWGRYYLPIPLRTPILIVIGKPIQCPKVENPTEEQINHYHELYLKETKILFDKYKNTYGWKDKTLCFK